MIELGLYQQLDQIHQCLAECVSERASVGETRHAENIDKKAFTPEAHYLHKNSRAIGYSGGVKLTFSSRTHPVLSSY